MAVSIEEALETLYTAGFLIRLKPGQAWEYISLGVVVENEGEENALILAVKDQIF